MATKIIFAWFLLLATGMYFISSANAGAKNNGSEAIVHLICNITNDYFESTYNAASGRTYKKEKSINETVRYKIDSRNEELILVDFQSSVPLLDISERRYYAAFPLGDSNRKIEIDRVTGKFKQEDLRHHESGNGYDQKIKSGTCRRVNPDEMAPKF